MCVCDKSDCAVVRSRARFCACTARACVPACARKGCHYTNACRNRQSDAVFAKDRAQPKQPYNTELHQMWYRIVSADNDSAFKNAMSQEMVPGCLRKICEGHARPITKNAGLPRYYPEGSVRPPTERRSKLSPILSNRAPFFTRTNQRAVQWHCLKKSVPGLSKRCWAQSLGMWPPFSS